MLLLICQGLRLPFYFLFSIISVFCFCFVFPAFLWATLTFFRIPFLCVYSGYFVLFFNHTVFEYTLCIAFLTIALGITCVYTHTHTHTHNITVSWCYHFSRFSVLLDCVFSGPLASENWPLLVVFWLHPLAFPDCWLLDLQVQDI